MLLQCLLILIICIVVIIITIRLYCVLKLLHSFITLHNNPRKQHSLLIAAQFPLGTFTMASHASHTAHLFVVSYSNFHLETIAYYSFYSYQYSHLSFLYCYLWRHIYLCVYKPSTHFTSHVTPLLSTSQALFDSFQK